MNVFLIKQYRSSQGIKLPEFGKYATGIIYLDKNTHAEAEKDFDTLAASLGIKIITWRTVPTDINAIGAVARKSEPFSRQVFVTADLDEDSLKRQVRKKSYLFLAKKRNFLLRQYDLFLIGICASKTRNSRA
jgi:glutamate synthase (NADPH/NADH)